MARRYKQHSSTGPDGWSRQDIASLNEEPLTYLASMFHTIQAGAPWPQQLLTGFVCPARKTAGAESPGQYRPIILLSFLYRLWASGTSRAILPSLASLASSHVHGFVPQRRTTDLWLLVQATIESTYFENSSIAGLNLDLIKCFNYLPRTPLRDALRCMGVPEQALVPWFNGLSQLQRRFKIGGSVGKAYQSATGCPEGDPLSCVMMLGFSILMDVYMQQYSGACILTSYVDNIQLLTSDAGQLQHGLLTARVFLNMLDLQDDPRKTYAWGNSTTVRQQLRAMGLQVRLAMKDLGAQMVFCRRACSQTADDRFAEMSDFWNTLRKSLAPKWYKLLALRMAGWPRVLHGVENKKCPASFTMRLRSKAVYALGWRHAGTSPWVRWSLTQPFDCDPEFYQCWAILRTALRIFNTFPWFCDQWRYFMLSSDRRHCQGPLHTLAQVLEIFGWTWDADLVLHAEGFDFVFERLHQSLLRLLFEQAWDKFVCQQVRVRKDFADLCSIDRSASFNVITQNTGDAELLATIQDGTFFTGNHLAKFAADCSGFCLICDEEDDLTHRCLRCPRYEEVRQRHIPCVRRWSEFGPSFNLHGLVPRNQFLDDWYRYFWQIPNTIEFRFHPSPAKLYDLFTDGSCSTVSGFRFAAWAVVLPEQDRIVAQGCLAGLIQTINRAEVQAVLAALRWKLHTHCAIRLWTDSTYVLTNMQHLRRSLQVPEHWNNKDLWQEMLQLIYAIDWRTCSLHKVAAHLDPAQTQSPYEDWLLRGNRQADSAAKRCNHDRGSHFEELLQSLCQRQEQLHRLGRSQRSFLLDVSRLDLDRYSYVPEPDPEDATLASLLCAAETNDCCVASILADVTFNEWSGQRFELAFLRLLCEWIAGIDILSSCKVPVSLAELVLGFCIANHVYFPIPSPSGILPAFSFPSTVALGSLMRPTLAGSCAIMREALEHLFALQGAEVPFLKGPRVASNIHCHVSCFMVGWPSSLAVEVSSLLFRFVSHPIRKGQDLARSYSHLV